MTIKAIVFAGKANVFSVRLVSGGRAEDLSSVTRMTIDVNGVIVDSDVHQEAFDWVTDGAQGKVYFKLGPHITNPTKGYVQAELTVYDSVYPEGIVWEQSCSVPNLYICVKD